MMQHNWSSKSDRGVVFRKKGHEAQFQFNSDVEDLFGCALTEAMKLSVNEATSKTIESLQQELRAGRRAIANRQKLIMTIDRSEFGWAVVEAYESNDLASDSKDEKQLIKVERDAVRKL